MTDTTKHTPPPGRVLTGACGNCGHVAHPRPMEPFAQKLFEPKHWPECRIPFSNEEAENIAQREDVALGKLQRAIGLRAPAVQQRKTGDPGGYPYVGLFRARSVSLIKCGQSCDLRQRFNAHYQAGPERKRKFLTDIWVDAWSEHAVLAEGRARAELEPYPRAGGRRSEWIMSAHQDEAETFQHVVEVMTKHLRLAESTCIRCLSAEPHDEP